METTVNFEADKARIARDILKKVCLYRQRTPIDFLRSLQYKACKPIFRRFTRFFYERGKHFPLHFPQWEA